VIHRAARQHDRVLCGALGCRSVSIGYFKSRCSASGYKVERDKQVRYLKKEHCRSVHGAKDGIADVKPSTLEAIIRTCKSRGSIKKIEKSIAGVS
jgi:hypothetical protein